MDRRERVDLRAWPASQGTQDYLVSTDTTVHLALTVFQGATEQREKQAGTVLMASLVYKVLLVFLASAGRRAMLEESLASSH